MSLLGLLREYQALPPGLRKDGVWAFLKRRDPWVFSHHPPLATFRSHVWHFRGLHFCKGCVMTWLGTAVGVSIHGALWIGAEWRFGETWPWWLCALTCFGLALPTLISSVTETPDLGRHVARFLLGILVAFALAYLAFAPFDWLGWAGRATVVGAYFAIKIPLTRRRDRLNAEVAAHGSVTSAVKVAAPLTRSFKQRKKNR